MQFMPYRKVESFQALERVWFVKESKKHRCTSIQTQIPRPNAMQMVKCPKRYTFNMSHLAKI